ncbi:LysR family transcriptional regulator [Actibacterium pelagium]|uniref:LysR family transcriptional regulator n=1 Tax=Actibacterium pelagium TaxID=2029103 RepID=A0A917AP71_9RHOB|nr:LysR family transcriptional regulator [Actibacterium pelagium]GGE62426.1 LysR family transcriptional regulator [Actibacterium pelagium]
MRINYDFSDLEAFLTVKETGSFNLAADRLNLSQSAVTRRVQKLETALDTVLFERTTRAVKPTLAAKRLQARAEAILENARETTLAMRDESVAFAHQRNALVTVAIIPTVVKSILPRAIRQFHEEGQSARFRVLDRNANAVAEAVASGEADFGICSIPELEPNTRFEPLFDDQIVLALRAEHPLTAKERVTWTDIAGEELIVPTRGTGNRLLIDEAMARAGLPLPWSYEIRRSTTALDFVSEGIGLALLPLSAVASFTDKRVTFRPIENPTILRPVGILDRVGQKATASEDSFKDIIRAITAEL